MSISHNLELDFLLPAGGLHATESARRDDIQIVNSQEGMQEAILTLEATRLKITHRFEKLASLSNSRTRLLPHQIEATYRVASSSSARFLIADEVGLGKTIEAGLIIKELVLRRNYRRILIIVPASLAMQWQAELQTKFNEDFQILNRNTFASFSQNARDARFITSVDFIKNPKYAGAVLSRRWDMAIFDEAHRLRRDLNASTKAFAFAEAIAERCESLLLLSATPFRGKLEELFFLVRLLDPHLLGPQSAFVNDYVMGNRPPSELRDRLSSIMLRRRKIEVGGFTRRHARTVQLELSPAERTLYDAVTEYVRDGYNRAQESANRMTGLVMIAFQKLLDSSTRALLAALERRRARLEGELFGTRPAKREQILEDQDDWLDDEELLEKACDGMERSALSEMRQEILILKRLINLARAVKLDRKCRALKELIADLKSKGYEKLIIFTQFRTTMEYLATELDEYSISVFHGGLSLKEKEEAIASFQKEKEILICTEAGGEGRNLQFACILINYDLPWSPLKIEQRIGRVHRFGQKKDVLILNFATRDTVAERVLEVLQNKIKIFEESIGPSDALLGDLEDENRLQHSIMKYITGKKSRSDLDLELEERQKIAASGFSKLNELVAPRRVDFNLEDYYRHTGKERNIDNQVLENFVSQYYKRSVSDHFELQKKILPENRLKINASAIEYELVNLETGQRKPATFKSEAALENDALEFLALGHRAVDQALDFFLNRRVISLCASVAAPGPGLDGLYYIYVVHFSKLKHAALCSALVKPSGEITECAELLIPFGFEARARRSSCPDFKAHELEVRQYLSESAQKKALELADRAELKFEKKKYELSFGKKIRLLEEKIDRLKNKMRFDSSIQTRSQLTRAENDIKKARLEKSLAFDRLERESFVRAELDLLQIYHFV